MAVIGAGAAGLTAAREANLRGARTVLISDGPLGGECTHTGCVPSKTLLAEAGRGASFAEAMASVRGRVETIAATEDASTLVAEGIDVLNCTARLAGDGRIEVDGGVLGSGRIVLATGTRPRVPPVDGLEGTPFLTNEMVFGLDRDPGRLVVMGAGSTGVEMAQAFSLLGTSVSLVEAAADVLPGEEPEASAVVRSQLTRAGVDVRVGRPVESVRADRDGISVGCGDATILADRLLVATGRAPRTDGLGLETTGVELDELGFIRTDATMATTAPGVWAIGDVTGRMGTTHAAARMAVVAVSDALGGRLRLRRQRFEPGAIPRVVFTSPEVARVGVTEAEVFGGRARVAFVPLSEVDRGVISGETGGFVKLIAGPRRGLGNVGGGRLLGATIVAPTAGDMIGELALVMQTGAFTGRLAETTHPYPSWSMAIQHAAAQFFRTHRGRSARPVGRSS